MKRDESSDNVLNFALSSLLLFVDAREQFLEFRSPCDLQVQSFLQPPMEGIILQTYGAGNAPDSRTDLISGLKAACDRDVIIVNCSQCATGFVTDEYAAGRVSVGTGAREWHFGGKAKE